MCNCKNIRGASKEAFDQMVQLPYKGKIVSIDPCIVDEIKYLWSVGIDTRGSCCGHNNHEGTIIVAEKDIKKMQKLGYNVSTLYQDRPDMFKAKFTVNNKFKDDERRTSKKAI
jgi:uncharacterized protein (DUF1919 family)